MTTDTTPEARRITIVALLIVLFLSALDQNVVGTAMPQIVAELKGLNLYAWITTIYLLTSTVTVPIWGKLGDLYGRKRILLIGVLIFLVGSWLCGLAGEFRSLPLLGGGMTQLIAFRGLQGIGGGALFTSAFAVMAELFPPRERGKLSGYFGGMFGLASVIGPLMGGALTDYGTVTLWGFTIEGWRWCFYVNLPLGALALFMILAKTPALRAGQGGRIDWAGAILILTAFVPLLLALSWGGHDHPWDSPLVLGLFAVFAVSLLLFVVAERFAPEPIVPLGLFRIPTFTWCNIAAFILNMSFMGVVLFIALYLQLGLGVSPTASGMAMLPLLVGLIGSAIVSGRLVSKTGRYKPMMVGGALFVVLGVFLLTQIDADTSLHGVMWRLLVLGIGLGPAQGLFSMAVQNAAPPERIGVATSSSQFFRQIGATVGAALFGAIMTQALAAQMAKVSARGGAPMTFDQLQALVVQNAVKGHAGGPVTVDPFVRTAFSTAMVEVFWVGLGIAVLGLIAVLFVPELPLRSRLPAQQEAEPVAEPGEEKLFE
jgi:EmrB/QacA subfamily drug resistance transporter